MKNFSVFMLFSMVFSFLTIQFGVWDGFKKVADEVHHFEKKSKKLEIENSKLKLSVNDLKAKLLKTQAKNEHLSFSLKGKKRAFRKIASIDKDDLVQFDIYNWSAEKLLDIAEQSFFFKKYNKSAQFYGALMKHYPKSDLITAKVMFNAGISNFEFGKNYKNAIANFEKINEKFPKSKYSKGAKLWLALSYHKSGKNGRFMASVEEFRLKYRNTKEWQVLSRYYEDIAFKYKK